MFVILGHRSLLKLNDEHFVLRALLVLLISKAVMFHPLQTTFLRDWILFVDDTVTNVILVILSRNFLSSFRALQWLFFVVRCCRVIDSRELIYIHVKRVSTLLQIYIFFFSIIVNDSRFICTSSKLIDSVKHYLFDPNNYLNAMCMADTVRKMN